MDTDKWDLAKLTAKKRIALIILDGSQEGRVKGAGSNDTLRCSFCQKSQDVVGKLISSPSDYPRAYICDECIAVCNAILEDDKSDQRHNMNMPVQTTVELPEALHESLRLRAERTGASIPALIVSAIEKVYSEREKGAYVTGPLVTGAGKLGPAFPEDENPHDLVFS